MMSLTFAGLESSLSLSLSNSPGVGNLKRPFQSWSWNANDVKTKTKWSSYIFVAYFNFSSNYFVGDIPCLVHSSRGGTVYLLLTVLRGGAGSHVPLGLLSILTDVWGITRPPCSLYLWGRNNIPQNGWQRRRRRERTQPTLFRLDVATGTLHNVTLTMMMMMPEIIHDGETKKKKNNIYWKNAAYSMQLAMRTNMHG